VALENTQNGCTFNSTIIRMQKISFLLFSVIFSMAAVAQPNVSPAGTEAVPSADDVIKEACKTAKKENKNVLVMFHASWCGWCHRMDTSLNDPVCRQFFYENYVIRHLVIDETPGNEKYENPGVYALRTKYHGDGQGIPFWVILDKDGKLLADSKLRTAGEGADGGQNIGCPANPEEVDYFVELLKKTSRLNQDQLQIIATRFRKNK
jgi:thioredoxin-related protein